MPKRKPICGSRVHPPRSSWWSVSACPAAGVKRVGNHWAFLLGSVQALLGTGNKHLSGEISFALSQSEKFHRGILVLGKRNQTQLIPSGPMPLIKPTEFSSADPARGREVGGAGAVQFSEFHLWLRPFRTSPSLRFQGIPLPACKHREWRPALPSDHRGSQTLPIFLETLAARRPACCLMQQFATLIWEPSLPRGAGRPADAHAPGRGPAGPAGKTLCTTVLEAGRAERPLAARAGDLSLIKLLLRHWLTDWPSAPKKIRKARIALNATGKRSWGVGFWFPELLCLWIQHPFPTHPTSNPHCCQGSKSH